MYYIVYLVVDNVLYCEFVSTSFLSMDLAVTISWFNQCCCMFFIITIVFVSLFARALIASSRPTK